VIFFYDLSRKFMPFPMIAVGLAYESLISSNPLNTGFSHNVVASESFLQMPRIISILVGCWSSIKKSFSTVIGCNSYSFKTAYS
jgi:hypothetical protein